MKNSKKLLILVLSLVMLIAAFAMCVSAEVDDKATVQYPDGTTVQYAVGETIIPPFGATYIEEYDAMVGRGVSDNKGPWVACLFAMRMLRDLGWPLRHGIRLMCGMSEETGMQDMQALDAAIEMIFGRA